ncbi:hypothetical protein KSS87_020111 [Heliosperma pusillum]|nr:hypothetical protein KSS87_020111 [Heliosperma pusillum]
MILMKKQRSINYSVRSLLNFNIFLKYCLLKFFILIIIIIYINY